MGHSGGVVAEGAGIFAVIRAWLVGGVGYAPGCTMVTVSPVGLPSGTESSSMGLSTGFHLLGHFHGPIPSALGIYSGHWVVVVGRWEVLWVFRQFCGGFHGWLVVIQGLCLCGGGLTWGRWLHLLWHGGPVLVAFEAGCAWSGRCSQHGTRQEAHPGFALVGIRQGWWSGRR